MKKTCKTCKYDNINGNICDIDKSKQCLFLYSYWEPKDPITPEPKVFLVNPLSKTDVYAASFANCKSEVER